MSYIRDCPSNSSVSCNIGIQCRQPHASPLALLADDFLTLKTPSPPVPKPPPSFSSSSSCPKLRTGLIPLSPFVLIFFRIFLGLDPEVADDRSPPDSLLPGLLEAGAELVGGEMPTLASEALPSSSEDPPLTLPTVLFRNSFLRGLNMTVVLEAMGRCLTSPSKHRCWLKWVLPNKSRYKFG